MEKKTDGFSVEDSIVLAEVPITAVLPQEFNVQAIWARERGAAMINFRLDRATRHGQDAEALDTDDVRHGGLSLSTLADLHKAFTALRPEERPIFVAAGAEGAPVLGMFSALLSANGQADSALRGTIGADPLGVLASEGTLPMDIDSLYDEMAATVLWADENMPELRTVLVDMVPYHAAGAAAAREIGYAAATVEEYMKELVKRGVPVDMFMRHLTVSFAEGIDSGLDKAKIDAAAAIIGRVAQGCAGVQFVVLPRQKAMYPASMVLGTIRERVVDEYILSGMNDISRAADVTGSLTEIGMANLEAVRESGGILRLLSDGVVQQCIADDLNKRLNRWAERLDNAETPLAPRRRSAFYGVDTQRILWQRDRDISEYRADIDEAVSAASILELEHTEQSSSELLTAVKKAYLSGATIGDVVIALHRGEDDFFIDSTLPRHKASAEFLKLRRFVSGFVKDYSEKPLLYLARLSAELSRCDKGVETQLARVMAPAGLAFVGEEFFSAKDAAEHALRSGAQVIAFAASPEMEYAIEEAAAEVREQGADMFIIGVGNIERTDNIDCVFNSTSSCLTLLGWTERDEY